MMQKEMDLYVRITDALFDLRDSLPGLAPEEKAELLMVALFVVLPKSPELN